MAAYEIARQARFEHGEHGGPRQGDKRSAPLLNQDIPLLPAYIKRRMEGDRLHVWCEHCRYWHEHGPDEQYQMLRAGCTSSVHFYRIYHAGYLLPDIERMHGRVPKDIVPLTEQQLACWVAVHQTPRIFRKLGRHLYLQQLLELLELNGRTEHIQRTTFFERPLYLGWMLLHTPQVHWLRRTPWRFRLREEYLQQAQQQKLPIVLFPEKLDHVPHWLQACTESSDDKLSDWVAYTSYVQWAEGKGYIKLPKNEWDEAMQELGYVARWHKVPNQGEQRYYEGIRLK